VVDLLNHECVLYIFREVDEQQELIVNAKSHVEQSVIRMIEYAIDKTVKEQVH